MYNLGVICEWMSEKDNYAVFSQPYHMVGSDGIALAPYGELASFKFHPRAYDLSESNSEICAERSSVELEQAIHKMTLMPAQRGIIDRG